MSQSHVPMVVTAAVVRRNSEILIAKRHSTDPHIAGKWEFPGGKLEFGEKPEDCIKREIKEELNIEISVHSLIGVSSHIYKKQGIDRHIVLLCYLCDYVAGDLELLDAADAKWIEPSTITKFDLAEADVPLLPFVSEKLSRS